MMRFVSISQLTNCKDTCLWTEQGLSCDCWVGHNTNYPSQLPYLWSPYV